MEFDYGKNQKGVFSVQLEVIELDDDLVKTPLR